ncbi:CDP-alcohol phosphatidyltransferase family protein [candidate division KSB1 bacterium]|nr:CDP-alcohol phosphatidyltransferase family protein [candidate division KSB1 bacterium]
MKKFQFLPENLKARFLGVITPITDFFVKLGVNPNFFTTVGLIISLIASFYLAAGSLRLGGALVLLGGIFDTFDGKVARASNRVTKFGALYDSTLDRYSEVFVFFGLAYYFTQNELSVIGYNWESVILVAICMAIGGSVMTSYVRARAEGLGLECKVGIMQRAERVVYLGVGALIHEVTLLIAIVLIAILANITAIHRLYHVWQSENKQN